jgi:hypothetical protein
MRRLLLSLMLALAAGCYAPPPRGGVTPYPPGPVDLISILLGNDYSRLCPQNYDYCRAGKHSVCCPRGSCYESDGRPYCGEPRGYTEREEREPPSDDGGPCGARATTCVRGGVTLCCAEDEGCCSDDQGLYCCGGGRSRRHGGY